MEEIARIIIDKIVICGFAAIKNRIKLQFDKHSNLIDGPANDVNQTIPLAIDFILNPLYQDKKLALQCRNEKCEKKNKNKAYVTLYLIASKTITLNGKDATHFEVTRFVSDERIDFIYFREHIKRKLNVKLFHEELTLVPFLRINEPIISERTRPTSSDFNKIFVEQFCSQATRENFNNNEYNEKVFMVEYQAWFDLLKLEKDRTDEAREFLIELRTIEAAKLKKDIDKLSANPGEKGKNAQKLKGKQRELFKLINADKFETIQRSYFNEHKDHLQASNNTEYKYYSFDLTELNHSFTTFLNEWQRYSENLNTALNIKYEVMEYNEMLHMKRVLHRYIDDPRITNAEFSEDCDKYIATSEGNLRFLYQFEGYQENKKLVKRDKSQFIEDQHSALIDEVIKFKRLAQDHIDDNIDRLKYEQQFLLCTNRLAFAQLTIDSFFETQMMLHPQWIFSWRVGFLALTLKSSYEQNVANNFIGNMLDFVDPEKNIAILKMALMFICNFFALFMFKIETTVNAFDDLVKPFLKAGGTVYSYAIDSNYSNQSKNMPFDSLGDFILQEGVDKKVKNWFDHFRVCNSEHNSIDLRAQAKQYHCKIICGNKCYYEDGHVVTVLSSRSADEMQDFVKQWQVVVKQRQEKIKQLNVKYMLDADADKKGHAAVDSSNQRLQNKEKITTLLVNMANGMKNLVQQTDTFYKHFGELEMKEKIRIKVYRRKKELLAEGNPHPSIDQQQLREIPVVSSKPVMEAIVDFEKFAVVVVDNILDKNPVHPDAIDRMKKEINILQNNLNFLKTFNYREKFETMNVESESQLKEMCRQIDIEIFAHSIYLEEYHEALEKDGKIKKFPKWFNSNNVDNLAKLSFNDLREMSRKCFERVPEDLCLPDINADITLLVERHAQINDCVDIIVEKCENVNSEKHLIHSYFDALVYMLQSIYAIDAHDNDDKDFLGFEIDFLDRSSVYIFPSTDFNDELFEQLSVKTLCDINTGLSFVDKADEANNVAITNDLMTVKRNRFGLLFYLALSTWINPSLIILNNTIIGYPADSLQHIVQLFQLIYNENEMASNKRQVIVVSRTQNTYDGIFKQGFKHFTCKKRGDDVEITQQDITSTEALTSSSS